MYVALVAQEWFYLEEVATLSNRSRRARAIRVTALPSPTLVESCLPTFENNYFIFEHPLVTLQMAKSFIWRSVKIMSEPTPVIEGVFGILSSQRFTLVNSLTQFPSSRSQANCSLVRPSSPRSSKTLEPFQDIRSLDPS